MEIFQDQEMIIQTAYGSAKDISVYTSIGLKCEQIYIVGKASKKQHGVAQVIIFFSTNYLEVHYYLLFNKFFLTP